MGALNTEKYSNSRLFVQVSFPVIGVFKVPNLQLVFHLIHHENIYSEYPKCLYFEIFICAFYIFAFVSRKCNYYGHLFGWDSPPFYKIITVESKFLLNVCYPVTYQSQPNE